MAEKANDFSFNDPTHLGTRYDWEEWFSGEIWKLTPGVDFATDVHSFRSVVYMAAKARGLKVRTSFRGGALFIQAYKADDCE